jgi:hypothetical protein
MLEHLVAPTNAAVFVATSMPGAGNKGSGSRKSYHAQKLGLQVLREHIGSSLRGGATWSEGSAMSADGIAKWAGLHAANSSSTYLFELHLKRWACFRIAAEDPEGPYDIMVSMRPDLYVLKPWELTMTSGERRNKMFHLRVGSHSPMTFGEDKVVLNNFTFGCSSDWIMVSGMRAAAMHSQLVHHLATAATFLPCPGAKHQGGEVLLGTYLWRVGLARQLYSMKVELARKIGPNQLHVNASKRKSWSARDNAREATQKYCVQPAFEDYADGFTLEDGDEVAKDAKHLGGVITPFVRAQSNLNTRLLGCGGALFPPCEDEVDLMRPLTPCTRVRHAQRISSIGRGRSFPAVCVPGPCAPLPNVSYCDRNGTMRAAEIFA